MDFQDHNSLITEDKNVQNFSYYIIEEVISEVNYWKYDKCESIDKKEDFKDLQMYSSPVWDFCDKRQFKDCLVSQVKLRSLTVWGCRGSVMKNIEIQIQNDKISNKK